MFLIAHIIGGLASLIVSLAGGWRLLQGNTSEALYRLGIGLLAFETATGAWLLYQNASLKACALLGAYLLLTVPVTALQHRRIASSTLATQKASRF